MKRSATGITNAHSILLAALLFLACTHTDSWVTPPISTMPPFSTGSDVQITFNVDQDYWPTWNGDGKGILYAYVDRERVNHRCLGMLAPAGGTRLWQLCDNRAIRDDSITSFAAFAMDTAGQLLVAEAVSGIVQDQFGLPLTSLWLADTAHPYVRTTLLVLPIVVGTSPITWLADLAWTGPNTFVVLGQQFNTVPHCVTAPLPISLQLATQCNSRDTIWADSGGVVLRGTIAAGHATLQTVAGTEGATAYSLAENGASIVFTLRYRTQLFKVPTEGGVPSPAPAKPTSDSVELMGVSCKGTTCIVARNELFITAPSISPPTPCCQDIAHFFFVEGPTYPTHPLGLMELHRVSLTTGTDQILNVNSTHVVFATPQISPVSGDVVLQTGGGWGHLQTFATKALPILWDPDGNSVLHLYKGVVP